MRFRLAFAVLLAVALKVLPAAEAPTLRIGDSIRPTHYSVELTLDPAKDTFTGSIDITLDVRNAEETLWLNAVQLKVQDATIGGVPAKVIPGNDQVIGLSTGRALPAGHVIAHITYSGAISSQSSAGIFRLEEDKRWYIYTQFEPTDARRAFPSFDDPGIKTPWDVALRVPKGMLAVANTPETKSTDLGDGMRLVRFATTRPIPTYLLAFGVGPFDIVDVGKAGRKNTPMRIIVPQGKKGEAAFAASAVPQLLQRLEDYFGTPYPYPKLDSLIMPIAGFAMENVGLITYGEGLFLSKPETDSINRQRSCAAVAAHEMAHQWFGDLVTTAWWDDIWLNEAFATWMEGKIVREWKPDWHIDTTEVNDRLFAMGEDSLTTSRRIRQPIESDHDIANAFDAITYQKGAAVLRMFETWIGPGKFRDGVRDYLKQNADGNATVREFVAAISKSAGKDVAPAFSTFLDQAGVPMVSLDLDCKDEKKPQLALSQKRYFPLGSTGDPKQTWRVPVCVKYEAGGQVLSQCEVLNDPRSTMALTAAHACPAWVMGNNGGDGYYRVAYSPATLKRLLTSGVDRLTLPEKISLMGDINALVGSGDLPAADSLPLVARFANAPERELAGATKESASRVVASYVPEDLLPTGRKFIRDHYGDRATKLGWTPSPGESEDNRLLRNSLVPFAASEGRVQPLIEEARRLAQAWLKDHSAVSPDMAGSVMSVAARFGDRAFFDQIVAALDTEKERRPRQILFGALGAFENPELARAALQLFLTKNYDPREGGLSVLFGPVQYPETRTAPFEFVKQNLDAILAKLPREVGSDFAAFLPFTAGGFCDAKGRAEAEGFFKDKVKTWSGGPRNLAQVLEQIDLCTKQRSVVAPSISEYLRNYR